ncbi:hypothetical protein PV458_09550 [Streptomyces sp. MN03-5084-2B]|nr:hypothetical protein [Streptomyces sp. MN03-5084-2B]
MGDSRNYSEATKGALFALTTKCYEPDCTQPSVSIFGDAPKKNVQIAHIRALSPNGPRYQPAGLPAMGTKERNSFPNLILLCEFHHGIVDSKANEHIYTVEILQRWKRNAEKDIRAKVDSLDRLTEDRLEDMLRGAAENTREQIDSSIAELRDISTSAAEVLQALFDSIAGHYLDREYVDRLDAATQRLYVLEDGSARLDMATSRLGDFEANSANVLQAAQSFGDDFVSASSRLLQASEEISFDKLNEAVDSLERAATAIDRCVPEVAQVKDSIDQSADALMEGIDDKLRSWKFGEPDVVVDDEQRWKWGLWGVVVGVVLVAAAEIALAIIMKG